MLRNILKNGRYKGRDAWPFRPAHLVDPHNNFFDCPGDLSSLFCFLTAFSLGNLGNTKLYNVYRIRKRD